VGVAVVESDTDTMSCCDDSSPDHYQPTGSHHCGGVVAANLKKTVTLAQHAGSSGGMAQCSRNSEVRTHHTGGVAHHSANSGEVIQHAVVPRGGVVGQQFHPSLSDDDEELDKLFASVEVCAYSVI